MSAAFALLLALGGGSTSPASSEWFDIVQGRGTNVMKVAQAARRCGFQTAEASIMHGRAIFHHPDDQGGELQLQKAEATPAARRCLWRKVSLLQKRYRDLYFLPDAP